MPIAPALITPGRVALTAAAKKALYRVLETNVIRPWQTARVDSFLIQLATDLRHEESSNYFTTKPDALLKKLTKVPMHAELVFEAYRRVCLSASRELGPRMIAMITSRLIQEGRVANEFEEIMLMAAEELRDIELREFSNLFRKAMVEHEALRQKLEEHSPHQVVEIDERDELLLYFEKTTRLPLLLRRLENLGIAIESETPVIGGSFLKTRAVAVRKESPTLVELIDRATGPASRG